MDEHTQGSGTAKEHSGTTGAELKDQLREAARETRERTSQAAHALKERYARAVNECKDGLVDRVSHVGGALHEAANRLRDDGDVNMADGIDAAARRVEDFTGYLRDADLDTVRRQSGDWVREHPQLVYGALFLAGLGLARILKASPEGWNARSERGGLGAPGGSVPASAPQY